MAHIVQGRVLCAGWCSVGRVLLVAVTGVNYEGCWKAIVGTETLIRSTLRTFSVDEAMHRSCKQFY